MTFDQNFYEFRGMCSYLLAHDFVDKNFTVIVSYDPKTKGETYILHFFIEKNTVLNIDIFTNVIIIIRFYFSRLS